jgi:fatty acid desaturase
MTDLKNVWKSQPEEEETMVMTLSEIHLRVTRLQSHVRFRNGLLLAYALANIAASFWLISTGRVSAYLYPMLLMVAAHLLVLWQVNRRVGRRTIGDGARPVLDSYRDELKRQADGLSQAWLWYIAPFMPPFLWELAIALQQIQASAAASAQAPDYRVFVMIVLAAICFWAAVWLAFSRAAVGLQLQMERLDALKAE